MFRSLSLGFFFLFFHLQCVLFFLFFHLLLVLGRRSRGCRRGSVLIRLLVIKRMVKASQSLIFLCSCTFSLGSQFSTSLFGCVVLLFTQVVTLGLISSHTVMRSVERMTSSRNLEVFVKILTLTSFILTARLQTVSARTDITLRSSFYKFLFFIDSVLLFKSLEGHTAETSNEV